MTTRGKLAIAGGIAAVLLIVLWRAGVVGDRATEVADGSGAGSAVAAAAEDDPWNKGPRRRIRGSGADDDPSAPELGTAMVTGQVRDRATQRPVEGAEVTFWGKIGERTTTSGPDGHYQVEVPFGAWSARALSGEDALSLTQAVRVNARTIAVDLELDRLAHVHGVVTDASGRPVRGAEVSNQGTDKGMREALDASVGRAVLTDGSGRYRLAVAAGEVRLVATAEGKLGHRAVPAVAAGGDLEVDLVLAPLATIDGTVVDEHGKPVPEAVVTAFVAILDIDLNVKREVATGADGRFMVVNLDPGLLTLSARTVDGAAAPGQLIPLDHGDLHDLVLRLAPAGTLAGRVTYSDGRPVGAATIKVKRMGLAESFAVTTTDRDGAWSVRGPVDAQFEVVARDEYGIARADRVTTAAPVELVIAVPGGLRGVVRTAKGEPIKDFTIAIDRVVLASNDRAQSGPPPQRFTSADGAFAWPHLEPGAYDLTFRAPGAATAHRQAVAVPDSAWAELEIALEPGAAITGVVHGNAATDGAPIANARVDARCAGTSTTTDARGAFTLADLPPGPCAIAVTAVGHAIAELRGQPGTPLDIALAASDGAASSSVEGIGAVLEPHRYGARVARMIATSSALQVGDVIVQIDGADATALGFAGILARARGAAGTTVKLTVRRGDADVELALPRLRFAVTGVVPGLA